MDPFSAALAGLLHDIGKFWQRAESHADQRLGPGYEGQFGKDDYGANGAHATWSAAYIERYIPRDLRGDLSTVLFHHRPIHAESRLIALADRLASGERTTTETAQPQHLLSVFSRIFMANRQHLYLPLTTLDLAAISPASLIAESDLPPGKVTRQQYAELWNAFAKDSDVLTVTTDLNALLISIYHLMERYTWCIPAAYYRSVPDISLFDHSRVTAAVAACLAADGLDDNTIHYLLETLSNKPDDQYPVAQLIEGDISGVQNFIYTITARGATSALRGRSFYLQLLTEAVARFVLRQLNLSITNLIYASGGHFYILAPAQANVNELQESLDRLLLGAHGGDLYLGLGAAQLTCADFQFDRFYRAWGYAGQQVSARKRRRFADLDTDALADLVFGVRGHGGNQEAECQVCHHEGVDVKTFDRGDGQSVRKCMLCASLEDLGRDLRAAKRLLIGDCKPVPDAGRSYDAILARFGMVATIIEPNGSGVPQRQMTAATIYGLGADLPTPKEAVQLEQRLRCPIARGQRLAVNVLPLRPDGQMATFEDLQKASHGLQRLGVLRMDVDNLGEVFLNGFRQRDEKGNEVNLSTLARVASLSAALSRYFEGWVGYLCQRLNQERREEHQTAEAVYTIYSGGDDLFIVGAWDAMPELARRISQDFAAYTGTNPKLHISGGLTLHGGSEPLYQAAELAHDALESAKETPGKNAFALLGQVVNWQDFESVRDYQRTLCQIVETTQNRSVLQILLSLHESYMDTVQQQLNQGALLRTRNGQRQIVWGPYMWRGIYQLRRLAMRANAESILKLLDELQAANFTNIGLLALAARWAEALTRRSPTN